MYHYTYMTASKTGHYYVGRHSTKNLNDNYFGSGKWVSACKQRGVELHKKIISFYETLEDLLIGEKELINNHYSCSLNMNLTTESVGFGIEDLNPARTAAERQRRSKHNWMKTDKGREWFSKNNPSRLEHVKKIKSEKLKQLWLDPQYRENRTKNHHTKSEEFRKFFSVHNPMKREEAKIAASKRVLEQLSEGNHSSKIRVSCTGCRETVSLCCFSRWHKLCK